MNSTDFTSTITGDDTNMLDDDGWTKNKIVGLVFLIIDLPVMTFFTVMFFLWRDRPTMQKRQPLFVVIAGLFTIFSIIDYAGTMVAKDWSCGVHRWGQHLAAPLFYTTYVIRAWCLYFQYHLAHNRVKAYLKESDDQEASQKILDEKDQQQDINESGSGSNNPDETAVNVRNSSDSFGEETDFFLKNQKWIDNKHLFAMFGINFAVYFIAWLIATLVDTEIVNNCHITSLTKNPVLLYVYLILLAYAIMYGVAAKYLWKVNDAFDIKSELKAVVISCLIVLILLIPFSTLADDNGLFFGVSTGVPAMIAYNFCFFWTIIVQVYRCWKNQRDEEKRYSSSASMTELNLTDVTVQRTNSTLDLKGAAAEAVENSKSEKSGKKKQEQQKGGLYDLLHSKKGFKAFKEFLTLEFSVENILFWDAVNKYHKISDSKLQVEAVKLRSNFISENSHTQVNLDVQTVKDINDAFTQGKVDRETFDVAQTYIFELMKTDSYRRFVRSKYNVFKKDKDASTVEP